jgi:hypothetical protein
VSGTASPAIYGKGLQLLKEAAPRSWRVAAIDFKYVDSVVTPGTHLRRLAAEAAARDLGVSLIAAGVDNPKDFEQAFALIVSEHADAIIDMGLPMALHTAAASSISLPRGGCLPSTLGVSFPKPVV